jgi:hypothetical protein
MSSCSCENHKQNYVCVLSCKGYQTSFDSPSCLRPKIIFLATAQGIRPLDQGAEGGGEIFMDLSSPRLILLTSFDTFPSGVALLELTWIQRTH